MIGLQDNNYSTKRFDQIKFDANVTEQSILKRTDNSRLLQIVFIGFSFVLIFAGILHWHFQYVNATILGELQFHRHLSIFGPEDTRKPVKDVTLYPYSAIGLLQWSSTITCTASLIAPLLILTAAECIIDMKTGAYKPHTVKPFFKTGFGIENYNSDGQATIVKIYKQTDFWKLWSPNTYVILELDLPLGLTYGILLLPKFADLAHNVGQTEVQMVGYSSPTESPMHYTKCTCYFPDSFNGPEYMLHHDCDTTSDRSPGSPMLVRYKSLETYIIGIHISEGIVQTTVPPDALLPEFTHSTTNVGVLASFVLKHMQSITPSQGSPHNENFDESTSSSSSHLSDDVMSGAKKGSKAITQPPSTSPIPKQTSKRIDQSTPTPNSNNNTTPDALESSQSNEIESLTGTTLPPAAAYLCIFVVACAWFIVIYIALRHIRNRNPSMVYNMHQ